MQVAEANALTVAAYADGGADTVQVCNQFDVPLEVVPLTEQYWKRVIEHCVREIRAGRTPNPDVLCNSRVKFGAFYEHLEKRAGAAFDRVASGHYARIERPDACPDSYASDQSTAEAMNGGAGASVAEANDGSNSAQAGSGSAGKSPHISTMDMRHLQARVSAAAAADGASAPVSSEASGGHAAAASVDAAVHARWHSNASASLSTALPEAGPASTLTAPPVRLRMTPDAIKDQTYFLAHLSQAQLSRALFPLGHFTKAQVREAAELLSLPTKNRKDSQGLCFLGKVKFSEFIKVRTCHVVAYAPLRLCTNLNLP